MPTLRDFMLAMLSHAVLSENRTTMTTREFYIGFATLYEKHPDSFPAPLHFRQDGGTPYSKQLESALNSFLPDVIGVNIMDELVIPHSTAIRNLAWLYERLGEWAHNMQPIAKEFAAAIPRRIIH